LRISPQTKGLGSDTSDSGDTLVTDKEFWCMTKLLITLVFWSFPALAQVDRLVPVQPVRIAEMTALPAISGRDMGTQRLERRDPPGRTLYRWSIAAVVAANAADVASSWSQQEANPVIAGGGAQFGASSMAIKTGFVAASLVIQHVALRHRPDLYKKLSWLNFGTAGVLGGVANYNMRVR
jgi:hypothetical protein